MKGLLFPPAAISDNFQEACVVTMGYCGLIIVVSPGKSGGTGVVAMGRHGQGTWEEQVL